MSKIKNVFILGVNGFPFGSARIEKLKLISKSLILENLNVTFVCNSWSYAKKGEISAKGKVEGIDYIYTSGISHRPETFLYRRWVKFKGFMGEIKFLKKNKCDAAIVSILSGMFFPLFFYWLFSRISGFKLFYPHHEEPEATMGKNIWYNKINLFLFNRFAWKMLDGAFPISFYLEKKIRKSNPGLPQLRIPAMVDFDIFYEIKESVVNTEEKYFMFCGSIVYFEIIEFVIGAFEKLADSSFNLHLVSSGDEKMKEKLNVRINQSPKKNQIFIFGFLDYSELVYKYINAKSLLIPLRDTIQDTARLPHKIGEYTASENPIITNKVGDIQYYFSDKKNALIAENYSEAEFSELMNFVIQHPAEAEKIGKEGYQTGLKLFNYKIYGSQILNFMETAGNEQ